MQYFVSDEVLQKIFKLNKAYIDAAQITYNQVIDTDPAKTFFDSMPSPEYKTAINSPNQGIYGSISKFDDTLCLMPYGLGYNLSESLDALRMIAQLGTDFYGISTPLTQTMGRMYAMIHYQLQNTLLTEPNITKISIIGHSYGGVISQVLGVLIYKLILYHSGGMSDAGKANMDRLYDQYLAPSISNFVFSTTARTPVVNEINERKIRNPSASFGDNIKSIDREIFSKVTLDMCVALGVINSLDISILDDPDLGLRESIQAFESGNKIEGDFFSKMYCIGMIIDGFFNVMDPRTPAGITGKLTNNFRDRILVGQLIMPSQNDWWNIRTHDYFVYLNLLHYNYTNSINIPMYTFNTVPKTNPFPLTRINLFAVGAFYATLSIPGFAMLLVCTIIGIIPEIIIPGYLIYLAAKYVLFAIWHISI